MNSYRHFPFSGVKKLNPSKKKGIATISSAFPFFYGFCYINMAKCDYNSFLSINRTNSRLEMIDIANKLGKKKEKHAQRARYTTLN